MSDSGAPSGRSDPGAIWTGMEMIVWGGNALNTGGRYIPATDTWGPVSIAGAPSGRRFHTAVWTGDRMVVWGGSGAAGQVFDTGGRYDPLSDTWSPTALVNAPAARGRHTAVWTGTAMLAWGGVVEDVVTGSGGRYFPDADGSPDADQDGVTICEDDCDDADPAIFPGAMQICDGKNNDCSASGWPATSGTNESDDDGDGPSECQGDCNDANAQVWGLPGAVPDLLFASATALCWEPPLSPGGTSVIYDVLRSGGPNDFFIGSACVETDDASDRLATDPSVPPAGGLSYYLIRGGNACGEGSLGSSSAGLPRTGRSCP